MAVTPSDYDTVGFPVYIRLDGSDDWMVTPTITPGIDKVQVFAGVRKLSDAAIGMIAENNAADGNSAGVVQIRVNTSNVYEFGSRGSLLIAPQTSDNHYAIPSTNVLSGLGDISGDSAILRVNGTQAASNTADQGTGNFGSYPLYIGRRGGTSLPFSGYIYSLIVRFGANLDTTTIEQTENWVNGKTLAY